MKRGSRLLALALVASAVVAPRLARAQSPEDRETARRLFDDGKARRDAGDAAGALEAFRAADALMNVPTTKLAVARAYLALGKLVEARDTALAVARIPAASNEPAPFTDARAAAAQLATEIAARIPTVTLALRGDAPDAVAIDGASVPREAWSAPRRVNPGKHTVVARLGAREVTADFTVAEGASVEVPLDVHASAEPPPAPTPNAPAASRPLGALFWIGAGVGVAGLAVGGVTGIVSMTNKQSADSICQSNRCPPSAYASLDAANTWATVSTVGFVAAGVGAALTVTALVLRPSARGTSTGLVVRPGGVGVVGSF